MKIEPSIKLSAVNLSGKCNIKIRVSHHHLTRFVATRFYIYPDEWDKVSNCVRPEHPNASSINIELRTICLGYEKKLITVDIEPLTIARIIEMLTAKTEINDFKAYFARFISEKMKDNERTAQIYQATLNKINLFDSRGLTFEEINAGWLRRFESWLLRPQGKRDGLKINAVAINMRNIRAVFNNAIDNDVIDINIYPFRRFKIEHEETEHRNITIEQLRAVRDYQTKWPTTLLSQKIAMLSFYLIGINNDDLFHAKEITKNGRLIYVRAKTHRKYSIKVEPEAMALITELKGEKSLLCLSERFPTVHDMTHSLNKGLKRMGIVPGLTIYHFRHTWATIAKAELHAPDEDIAQSLGHSKKTTTSIYAKQNPAVVDKLNRDIIDFVNSGFADGESWKASKEQKKTPPKQG